MAASTPPQPPPPIQTTTTEARSPSEGSSTITPGFSSTKPTTTPFSPFPPTPDYEDDVHSPSLTSGNALARFEFEKLDAKDGRDVGTKVLMVEWADDHSTREIAGSWTISWEGKSAAAVVETQPRTAAGEKKTDEAELHRLYFLLPHWTRVPGTVILTLTPSSGAQKDIVWRTHPLPAIYPPALGNSARASGKRGVLHTIWAKKRLQSLATEIENEELHNPEGVSLSLAIQEREWIEGNFGVKTKPRGLDLSAARGADVQNLSPGGLHSPTSPKSPGRGPLLEKLKGLKLATGDGALNTKQAEEAQKEHNPLSPETADVAVSWTSFANMNGLGDARDSLAARPAQSSSLQQQQGMKTIAPPESVLEQQRELGGMGSLNAFTAPAASSSEVHFRRGSVETSQPVTAACPNMSVAHQEEEEEEEDLFALPLSPRSPDRGAKKFTFGEEDTARYTPVSPQE